MRGLGHGQRLVVLLVAEVAALASDTVANLRRRASAGTVDALTMPSLADQTVLDPLTVCTWLLSNSLGSEAVQSRTLRLQRLAYVTRKHALRVLLGYRPGQPQIVPAPVARSTGAASVRPAAHAASVSAPKAEPPRHIAGTARPQARKPESGIEWLIVQLLALFRAGGFFRNVIVNASSQIEPAPATVVHLADPRAAPAPPAADPSPPGSSAVAPAEPSALQVLEFARWAFSEAVESSLPTTYVQREPRASQLRRFLAEHAPPGVGQIPELAKFLRDGGRDEDDADDGAVAFDAEQEVEAEAEAELEAEVQRPPPLARPHTLGTAPWRLLDALALALRHRRTVPPHLASAVPASAAASAAADPPAPWPWLPLSAFGVPAASGPSGAGGKPQAGHAWAVPAPPHVLVTANACRGTATWTGRPALYRIPERVFAPRALLWAAPHRPGPEFSPPDPGVGAALLLSLREAESVRSALWALQAAPLSPPVPVTLSLWLLPEAGAPPRRLAVASLASSRAANTHAAFPHAAAVHARFFACASDLTAAEATALLVSPGGAGRSLPTGGRAAVYAALAQARGLERVRGQEVSLWEHTPLAPVFLYEDGDEWYAVATFLGRISRALCAKYGSLQLAYAACVSAPVLAALAGSGVPLARLATFCTGPALETHTPASSTPGPGLSHPVTQPAAQDSAPEELLLLRAVRTLLGRHQALPALVTWPDLLELMTFGIPETQAGGT